MDRIEHQHRFTRKPFARTVSAQDGNNSRLPQVIALVLASTIMAPDRQPLIVRKNESDCPRIS